MYHILKVSVSFHPLFAVEVERQLASSTSTAPPSIGMAALGNGNGHGNETSAGRRAHGTVVTHLWSLAQLMLLVLLPLSY